MVKIKTNISIFKCLTALIYDGFILLTVAFVMTLIIVAIKHGQAVSPYTLWYQCSLLTLLVSYYCFSLTRGGQTIGMKSWHFHLTTIQGHPPKLKHVFSRLLLAPLAYSLFPLVLSHPHRLLTRWTHTILTFRAN